MLENIGVIENEIDSISAVGGKAVYRVLLCFVVADVL